MTQRTAKNVFEVSANSFNPLFEIKPDVKLET